MPPVDPYDELPYGDYAWQGSHPDQLAAVAWMRGLDPPPVETARVLELGCAAGGNLIAMAEGLPGAHLVGLDRSRVQVEQGRARLAQLGFDNVTLAQGDLADAAALDADPALQGSFDYVIAHGLWSWMPVAARQGLFRLAASRLAPGGVLYLSADVLPGCRFRQISRDLLGFHDDPGDPADARIDQARQILAVMAEACPPDSMHGAVLQAEARRAAEGEPSFVIHDRLSADYEPVLLAELARRAGAHGLRFVGDARPSHMTPAGLPAALEAALGAGDAGLLVRLQYADFVARRVFRRALFTGPGAPLSWPLDPARLDASHVRGDVEVRDVSGDEARGVERAAFEAITAAYPGSVPVASLAQTPADRARVRAMVMQAWAADTVQLRLRPSPAAATLPDRPRAPAVARLQASEGRPLVVNLLHGMVPVSPLHRVLLTAMDGRLDRGGLQSVAAVHAARGDLVVRADGERVEDPIALAGLLAEPVSRALRDLSRLGLVVAR